MHGESYSNLSNLMCERSLIIDLSMLIYILFLHIPKCVPNIPGNINCNNDEEIVDNIILC